MKKKLLLCLIPIVILLGCLVGTLCIMSINDGGGTKVYRQQIELADKCLADNDYENAIIYYTKAIEADQTQEKPYIALAEIYISRNDYSNAINILHNGFAATNSPTLQDLLSKYLSYDISGSEGIQSVSEKPVQTGSILNRTQLDIFVQYTYEKYSQYYAILSQNFMNRIYTVCYQGIDAEFSYYNTNENKNIVDESKGKPYPGASPNEIILNDISIILDGASEGITLEQIKRSPVYNVSVNYDNSLKKYIISFIYNGCKFSIECDKNGNIKGTDIYNKIEPVQAATSNGEITVSGRVISVTTAQNVFASELKFRSGKNNTAGTVVKDIKTTDGTYSVALPAGDYTVEVSASGYSTEYFDLSVKSSDTVVTRDFSISTALSSGEIRIVLEWGDNPSDLDSHLTGTTANGTPIDVNFMKKTAIKNGTVLAELDVDDMNGNGPETTTLYNSSGRFEFKVHKFSGTGSLATSQAVVKVYTNGSSQPTTISVPTDLNSDWWNVFTIENGQIKNINGSTI